MILTTHKNIKDKIATTKHVPTKQNNHVYPKKIKGPNSTIEFESGITHTFILDEYTYKPKSGTSLTFSDFTNLQEESVYNYDKNNIKWSLWVKDPSNTNLKIGSKGYIKINKRDQIDEYDRDFMVYKSDSNKIDDLLEAYAYTEAIIDTIVDTDGVTKNRLQIKLSKWLTDYDVHIEPFRNGPDLDVSEEYVYKKALTSKELIEVYWSNLQNQRITAAKFNSEIYLTLQTIGFNSQYSATVSLFYEHNGSEHSVDWSISSPNYTSQIQDRYINLLLDIESKTHTLYNQIQTDQGSEDIKVKVKVEIYDANNTLIEEAEGPEINILCNDEVKAYLATTETLNYTSPTSPSVFYHVVKQADLSSKATVVIEAPTVSDGEVISVEFYNSELDQDGLNCTLGGHIPLINDAGVQTFTLNLTVYDGRAESCIEFQTQETTEFVELNEWLYNQTVNGASTNFDIVTKYGALTFTNEDAFKLVRGVAVQKIYHDGRLSDTEYFVDQTKYVEYEYHAANGTVTSLGTYELKWIKKWRYPLLYSKDLDKTWVSGVDYFPHKKNPSTEEAKKRFYRYASNNAKIAIVTVFSGAAGNQFLTKSFSGIGLDLYIQTGGHDRRYLTPKQMGAVIGAAKDSGISNVTITGCVEDKGRGEPSKSHVNGNGVDFRLLRTDGVNTGITVNESKFDAEDMEKLIDSFKKFGYNNENKKYYSHYINNNSVEKYNGKLLKHCKKMAFHKDHLHIRGFQHSEGFVNPN